MRIDEKKIRHQLGALGALGSVDSYRTLTEYRRPNTGLLLLLKHWDREEKGRAPAWFALRPNTPTMTLDDMFDDGDDYITKPFSLRKIHSASLLEQIDRLTPEQLRASKWHSFEMSESNWKFRCLAFALRSVNWIALYGFPVQCVPRLYRAPCL